jgi:hypothetical protein
MPLGVTIDSKSSSSSKVTPKILAVIAAAATVFLGKEVRIRSARMLNAPDVVDTWARQGRLTVQTSHNLTRKGR